MSSSLCGLTIVAVLMITGMQNSKAPSKSMGILDARIHSKSSSRREDMSCVATEQHISSNPALRNRSAHRPASHRSDLNIAYRWGVVVPDTADSCKLDQLCAVLISEACH